MLPVHRTLVPALLLALGAAMTAPTAAQEPTASGPAYQALSANAKQQILWRLVSRTPYPTLPELGSAGVGTGIRDTLGALWTPGLRKTFDDSDDIREPRTKIFHPFGATAMVRYQPVPAPLSISVGLVRAIGGQTVQPGAPGYPYSGVFATGAVGIARLSLATDDASYIPGMGLKLMIDGQPSVNVHAIPNFDPQASKDFFHRSITTSLPEPTGVLFKVINWVFSFVAPPLRRPVDHVARVTNDGARETAPRAPYALTFEPGDAHFAPNSSEDFRTLLAGVAPGTVIYRVFATQSEGGDKVHIGNVVTQSPFVASAFSDRELHFLHRR